MARVATYVFIDLETTSLPALEYNKTRITELSMVVVKRRHVLDTRPGAAPRVQDKLTMCFNPRRTIAPESTDTSGLCNDLLEHQTEFNMNVFNTINCFLQCLEKPVCLIAQNGHTFDFPILKNHFEKLGVSLSDDILCADSLHAFYDIFESQRSANVSIVADISVIDNKMDCCKDLNADSLIDQKEDKARIQGDNISQDEQDCKYSNTSEKEAIITASLVDSDNEGDLKNQRLSQQMNERTPVHKQKLQKPLNKISKVRRKLFWGNNSKPEHSYKLKNIYERVLGRPGIEAHRAENDCIMAMEVAVSIAKQFVEWVDNNYCEFKEVKPMRLGYPLGE